MKILAVRRRHGDTSSDATRWTVEAATYDAAMAEVHVEVPDDGDLLSGQTVD